MTTLDTYEQFVIEFKLDKPENWQANKIVKTLMLLRENDDVHIQTCTHDFFGDKFNPQPLQDQVPRILDLSDHQLLMTKITNEGDEGGNCIEFFLLKPEWKNAYWGKWNDIDKSDNEKSRLTLDHRYLLKHPKQFIHIWCGPY